MESNISKLYMTITQDIANLSNCANKNGCIFIKDNNIIAIGFSTKLSGLDKSFIPKENGDTLLEQIDTFIVPAEINAVMNYKGNVSDFNDSVVYLTNCPNMYCAQILIQLKPQKIVYLEDSGTEEVEAAKYLFNKCCIVCQQFDKGEKANEDRR